jgi:hypothetical protein
MTFTHRRRAPDPVHLGKSRPLPGPPIAINSHSIKSSPTLKFLGVILNEELWFTAQADHITAKGKFWITQTRWVLKTAKGIKGYLACQLYNTAAVLAMFYGASVWLTPIC